MLDDAIPLTSTLIVQILPLAIGSAILAAAALHDVAARTIPNWTSLALAAIGMALRWADGQLLFALALAAIVFCAAVFCWQRGWLGGGDVKLLAAAAIFVPPASVGHMLCDTVLAGGLVALIYLISRTLMRGAALASPTALPRSAPVTARPKFARILRAERRRLRRGGPLPYGSAIAAGTILVIFTG